MVNYNNLENELLESLEEPLKITSGSRENLY